MRFKCVSHSWEVLVGYLVVLDNTASGQIAVEHH
uniref:Uncharacterized protein n=1 Tax=Anguilla anguilla TaxID=7936 RepID=A0A0E9QLF0_ANGAN